MSVTKVQRSNDITAAIVYVVYGNRQNLRQGTIRADAVTVFNSGSSDPLTAAQQWIDELRKNPEIVNEAQIIILSFHPNELSKHKKSNIELGHFAACELARRLESEGVFFIAATHTDSRSGHIHTHLVLPNFLPDSGKTPRNARNHHAVKRVNDEIMRELGLSVIEQQHQRQEITPEQRQDLLNGKTIDGSGKTIHELDDATWKHAVTSRIDAVFSSDEVMQAATVAEGLQAAQAVAPRYQLSIAVKENAKDDDKHAITFALIDDDGEVIRRHRKGKREGGSRVKVARPGSYFGDGYKLSALQELIEQQQIDWAAEQALAALLNSREDEEQEEKNEQFEQIAAGEADQASVDLTQLEAVGTGEKPDAGDQETAIAGDESATAVGRYCVVSSVADTIQPDDREPHPAARQLVIDRDTEQQRQQQTTEQRRRHAVRQQRQQQQRRQAAKQNDDWEFC